MTNENAKVPRREHIVYPHTAPMCRGFAEIFKEAGIEVKNSNPEGAPPTLVVVATPAEVQHVIGSLNFEPNIKTLG